MLPILRILPVGGVLLAILILVLALKPPDATYRALSPSLVEARGPLIDRDGHPEWRQLLLRAALLRADELNRLRELPDTPVHIGPVVPEPSELEPTAPASGQAAATDEAAVFAGLPVDRADADPDPEDITGAINESPGATMRVEIGETSSTELPIVLPEEQPPVILTPERAKPAHESRRKPVRRVRRAKTQPAPQPAPKNFFELLFSSQNSPQPAGVGAKKGAQKTVPATPAPRARADAN